MSPNPFSTCMDHPIRFFLLFISLLLTIIGAILVGDQGNEFHECVSVFIVFFIIIGILMEYRIVLFVLSGGLSYAIIPGFIVATDGIINNDRIKAGYILMTCGVLLSFLSILTSKDFSTIRDSIGRSDIGLIMAIILFIINFIGCILLWVDKNQLVFSIYFFFNSLLFLYFYFNHRIYYTAIAYFLFIYYGVFSLSFDIALYSNNNNNDKLTAGLSLIFAAHLLFIVLIYYMAKNNNNNNNNNNQGEQVEVGPAAICNNIIRFILLIVCLISTIIGCIVVMDSRSEALYDSITVIAVVLIIGTLYFGNDYPLLFYSLAFALLIITLPLFIYQRTNHRAHPQILSLEEKKIDAGLLLLIIGASCAFFIRVLSIDTIKNGNFIINNNNVSQSINDKGAVIVGMIGELFGFIGLIILFKLATDAPADITLIAITIPVVILLIFAFCILHYSSSIYFRLLFIALSAFILVSVIDGASDPVPPNNKQAELRQAGLALLSVALGLLEICFCILLWPINAESAQILPV